MASAATTFAFHRHWLLRFLGWSTASVSKKPSHIWPTPSGNRSDAQNGLAVNVTFSPVLISSRLKSRVYVRVPDVLPLVSCTILSASIRMTTIEVSRFSPVRTSRFRKTAVSPTFGSGLSAGGSVSAGQAVAHDSTNVDSANIANPPRKMDESMLSSSHFRSDKGIIAFQNKLGNGEVSSLATTFYPIESLAGSLRLA